MEKYNRLRSYIRENISTLYYDGGSGTFPTYPVYDLYPLDYIKYAEEEINLYKLEKSDRNLINCILHLKRALDCQMDLFLHVFNLYKIFKSKNLGINSKLKFLKDVGILNSRVIDRFTLLRNKIEHFYQIPKIDDLEVYFDLISSLISNIELSIYAMFSHSEVIFKNEKIDVSNEEEWLMIRYHFENPPFIEVKLKNHSYEILGCSVSAKEYKIFPDFFKILFFLIKKETSTSDREVLNNI